MIALTKEQIEQNKKFCEKRADKKKVRLIKSSPVEAMHQYIIDNHPCTCKEIEKATNSTYAYHPVGRQKIKALGQVDYCPKSKVWYVKGWPVDDYPRPSKIHQLISYIQRQKRITSSQARDLIGKVSRVYLTKLKNKGLIERVRRGVWEWTGI